MEVASTSRLLVRGSRHVAATKKYRARITRTRATPRISIALVCRSHASLMRTVEPARSLFFPLIDRLRLMNYHGLFGQIICSQIICAGELDAKESMARTVS